MNYIGSKQSLIEFINKTIHKYVGKNLSTMVFTDLFAGTGTVGRFFKSQVKQVVSNDLEYYSYILNYNYIQNNFIFNEDIMSLIYSLNYTPHVKGFIYREYAKKRKYFTLENAARIDAIRIKIEKWYEEEKINKDIYMFLLCSLLETADKVANTTGVYAAFLKQYQPEARTSLLLQPSCFEYGNGIVYNKDANELIKEIKGDILFLDPPYNKRHYGVYYFLLNVIAEYKEFVPQGICGYPPTYNKSQYGILKNVCNSFEDLIKKAQFKWIFFTYNNEGLMTLEEIKNIMSKYGEYNVESVEYLRYKADNREYKADKTIEYIHVLEK